MFTLEMRDWPFIVSVLGHLEHGIGIKYIPALRAREAEIARLSSRIEGIESDAYSGIDSLSERDVELLREAVRVCYELEQPEEKVYFQHIGIHEMQHCAYSGSETVETV